MTSKEVNAAIRESLGLPPKLEHNRFQIWSYSKGVQRQQYRRIIL